ncbi:hypothetical protein QWZ10_24205 [Paracoccus cavernae]|uniref:Uncharacterized protein n=1 Tax=Paracoccus cavernae TaxID=1571207 RepID=A0ABT8DBE2_9RHOB|nr:hypothetical protein [Paracoccus cavernae]
MTVLPKARASVKDQRGRKIVGAVHHHIGRADQPVGMFGPIGVENLDLGLWVDRQTGIARGLRLVPAHGRQIGKELAVEVRNLENIKIGQGQMPDPHADQRLDRGPAHAAGAADKDPCRAQALLLVLRDKSQIAGGQLAIDEGGAGGGGGGLRAVIGGHFQGRSPPHWRLESSQ